MKFGRNYHHYQIAEWADKYMNYGALKQMCKGSAEGVDFEELVLHCITAIDSVEHFYHNTYTILLLKLPLRTSYQGPRHDTELNLTGLFNLHELGHVESHHHKAAIVALVAELDKLRWYGRVNTDAFRKIIRRIDSLNAEGSSVFEGLGESEQGPNLYLRITARNFEKPSSIQQIFCTRIAKVDPSISALPIFRAIESDNSLELGKLIDAVCKGDLNSSRLQFLHVLFECSIQCCSKSSWVDVLISRAISLDAVLAIEDCLRDAVVKLGRAQSRRQQMTPSDHELSLPLLTYILDRLLAKGLNLLYRQNYLGRIPLHYACEYGLADVCEVFLESMKAWDLSGAGDSRSAILLRDMQLRSPLQLSVPGGHPEVTRLLIKFFGHGYGNHNKIFFSRFSTAAGELLLFAVRSNSTEALTSLLGTDIDINCCDALGQTPLYLAARSGNESFTPLIIASLEGFSAIVEVLLKHGANVEHRDLLGWTAIDHASYRGHIPLAKALVKTTKSLNHKQAMEIQYQLKTSLRQKLPSRGRPRRTSSAKESHIVVNLGSLDLSDTTPAVHLSPHLIENPSIMHPESLFSLGVSIVGRASPSHIIPLPLLEDATNTPWIFTTTDPSDAKLTFEILRNEPAATEDRELIGRGMCLLASYKRSPHTKRESLNRDYTVPILSTATLEYIEAVTFSLIISTPLVLPNTPPINTEELWFENGPSKVVGHRGLGKNILPSTRLQIGENSIQSFSSAVDLGASYVEFMHINNEQSDQRLSPCPINVETEYFRTPLRRRVRALSLSASDSVETEALRDRVKHTFDYNSRGYKGNTRGDFVHDAFVTFEQLLTQLPPHIGMDIELTIDDWNMDPFFVETNFFTDTILLCLSKYISSRSILLSSFSPEICILLALKQSRWPVLFGNDSGNWQPTEVRATTLQEGLSFAKKWNLDGLVLASEPFVYAPQLVGFVKGTGMVCATYGVLNDEVEGVVIQGMTGVDIIIVNNVRLVCETLAAPEER
ncbi:hypothetical protein F5882DRAFT_518383 [Hyaloscypha sp. PMI_1271]|nr:hypothetical protein F5882DRAFT_518383 [Hyaloscypha sp. PMI_1271]